MNSSPTLSPPRPDADTAARLNGVCTLAGLGVIQASGEDAAKFLHNQLTQDLLSLSAGQARLAALCTAKGRMQASFVCVRRDPDAVLLVCSRDLLAATLKRLSMFVLRAKVRLTDASDAFALWGLAGAAVAANAPGLAQQPPWRLQEAGDRSAVALYPAHGVPRALLVAPSGAPAPQGDALAPELWQWSEVASGVATITQPVVEAFVPQMLNYESVGGVNFKKGCYPGQEVVARSQFRGTLKRRAFIVHGAAALAAGDEVFQGSGAVSGEPCGTVVQAAPAPEGGFAAIVSMQVGAAEGGTLHARAPDGPALTLQPLPYPLLADI